MEEESFSLFNPNWSSLAGRTTDFIPSCRIQVAEYIALKVQESLLLPSYSLRCFNFMHSCCGWRVPVTHTQNRSVVAILRKEQHWTEQKHCTLCHTSLLPRAGGKTERVKCREIS